MANRLVGHGRTNKVPRAPDPDAPHPLQPERIFMNDSIDSIIEAAKAGDETTRHRATLLGRRLSGDVRARLFRELEIALAQAKVNQ